MRSSARAREAAGRALPFPREEELPPAHVVAGVDEAGLGPLLGPLTIGFSAFRVPAPDLDLWRALDTVVSRDPGQDGQLQGARLVVADSKVVFARNPRGEARLEASALAFLALRAHSRRPPVSAREMLARTPAELRGEVALETEPWFPFLPRRLPLYADEGGLDRTVAVLDGELRRIEVEVCAAGARVLPVVELNSSFARTSNKSRTHWDLSATVLRHLWSEHAREGLDLLVDRHGGRMRYAALLSETFPEARVATLCEQRARSEYAVVERSGGAGAPRRMRVAFAERAESASFAVALASCLAKYARETCMRAFNTYFGSLQPGLRPTAGYVSDGRRWLAEAGPAIERSGLQMQDLVRER